MFLSVFVSTIHPPLLLSPPWPHRVLFYTKNKETYVRLMFLDCKSAFNSIIQQKLVSMMAELWIPSSMCNWILLFLTGRPERIRKNNKKFSTIILNISSLQGSAWPMTTEPDTRKAIRRPRRWFWILAGLPQPSPPSSTSIVQLCRSSTLLKI